MSIYIIAILITGVTSGILGSILVLLLHFIQHIAYRYSLDQVITPISFLEGVTTASGHRRVIVMIICGVIAGFGWWFLYRFCKPLISIQEATSTEKTKMPVVSTIINVLLQIVTIALGSPLGREVAPRELSALFASWFSEKLGLNLKKTQTLIACSAGAGFAAVYNAPLGGGLFTIEVLLKSFNISNILTALTTSGIAVFISWKWLGHTILYPITHIPINLSIIVWSMLSGPIFGICAYYFRRITNQAKKNSPKDGYLIVLCLINFTLIGLLSIYFPVLLGNGMSPTRMVFLTPATAAFCALILLLRTLIVWSSFRAGAKGGLLFPSIANGALLAVILAAIWHHIWPSSTPSNIFAIIGATAFLAAAQKMPITAIVLMVEFTHINYDYIIPLLFSVIGAVGMCYFLEHNSEGQDKNNVS